MGHKESSAHEMVMVDINHLDFATERRTYTDAEEYRQLVHSIEEIGLVEALPVFPLVNGRYTLRRGNVRLRACREARLEQVRCLIDDRPVNAADEVLEWLASNDQVCLVNPIDRATAWEQAMKLNGWRQTQLANHLNLSQGYVSKLLSLIEEGVSPVLQDKVRNGTIPIVLALKILAIKDDAERDAAIEAGKIRSAGKEPREEEPAEEEKPAKIVHKADYAVPKKGRLGGVVWSFVGRKQKYKESEIIDELLLLVEHLRALNQPKLADLGEDAPAVESDEGPTTIPFANAA